MSQSSTQNALDIAVRDLRACYASQGIFAGGEHFSDLWVRDDAMASWWALELGDADVVRRGLDTILGHIHADGQLPLRIGCDRIGQIFKFFGIKLKGNHVLYTQDKGISRPQDQNSLILITLARYARMAPDGTEYVRTHADTIRQLYHWHESHMRGGLLWGGSFASWKDSVRMEGRTLINNTLLIAATDALADTIAPIIGDDPEGYRIHATNLRRSLREHLWTGEYYAEWRDDTERHDYFSVDGNILAITLGITDETETRSILQTMERYPEIVSPFGAITNTPAYKLKEVYWPFRLFGMDDYQNASMRWWWLGSAIVMAYCQIGDMVQARMQLGRIADVIVREGCIYEVYEKDGQPVRRRWYRSESPFAWGASYYVLAYHACYGQ